MKQHTTPPHRPNRFAQWIRRFPALALVPGVALTALLAWLSMVLGDFIGTAIMGFERSPVSAVMVAVLLGMGISNIVALPNLFKPGIRFSVNRVLRLGIILLGIRLSVFDVFQLGVVGLPIVLACILSALTFTILLSRWLRLSERLGTLIAVGTSICGVSAILATGPAIDAEDEDIAYAVAVITGFGLVATLLYPFLAHFLFPADATKVGLFLGTSIHDTSQVTGAGLVFAEVYASPRALDVATITKMVRNVMMVAVIPLMAFYYRRQPTEHPREDRPQIKLTTLLPLFVLGFIALAVFRSIGDASLNVHSQAYWTWTPREWAALIDLLQTWAVNFLVIALAGVGLSIRFEIFRNLGLKPFFVGLGAALIVGVVSTLMITVLASFVAL